MDRTELACPDCRNPGYLQTIEQIRGYAFVTTISGDGDIEFGGETNVDWNSSETIGVRCGACDWCFEGEQWLERRVRLRRTR